MIGCRLRLDAGASFAGRVAEFVLTLARTGTLHARQAYWLRLAADEITTNIAQHGYGGRGGVIDLEGGVETDRVWVRVEDDAPPFDPTRYDPAPRLAADPALREEGGYGLLLALGRLDEFVYDRVGGRNRNILVMRRTTREGE
ncbi:UNVERIFIED_ORG: anti-sigma regulatory factor (Ser/Thr protein kinase) [Microbispora rosea subsp. rosea]